MNNKTVRQKLDEIKDRASEISKVADFKRTNLIVASLIPSPILDNLFPYIMDSMNYTGYRNSDRKVAEYIANVMVDNLCKHSHLDGKSYLMTYEELLEKVAERHKPYVKYTIETSFAIDKIVLNMAMLHSLLFSDGEVSAIDEFIDSFIAAISLDEAKCEEFAFIAEKLKMINISLFLHSREMFRKGTFTCHTDARGGNMKFLGEQTDAYTHGFRGVRETFMTTNAKHVIRAFHWQGKPQQKIIKALNGSFNVRVVFPELGVIEVYDNVTQSSEPIFVPDGAQLGYVALEDNSHMLYLADDVFDGPSNHGVHPNSYGVDWGVGEFTPVISQKDADAELVGMNEKFLIINY